MSEGQQPEERVPNEEGSNILNLIRGEADIPPITHHVMYPRRYTPKDPLLCGYFRVFAMFVIMYFLPPVFPPFPAYVVPL